MDGVETNVENMKKLNSHDNLPTFLKSHNNLLSIELCSSILCYNQLNKLNASIYSITWHHKSREPLTWNSQIPPLSLAKKLIYQGKQILLHLAGNNLSKDEVVIILKRAQRIGVKNIFAVRGDFSKESGEKKDFVYAVDLVRFIRQHFGDYFTIGVSGYPATHPESLSRDEDLKYLKEKVDAGADFIITQFEFDLSNFIQFFNGCRKLNITVPILPGLYVFQSYKSLLFMAEKCGVEIPPYLLSTVKSIKENPEKVKEYGIQYVTDLARSLLSQTVTILPGLHIFSLNNLEAAGMVKNALDLI